MVQRGKQSIPSLHTPWSGGGGGVKLLWETVLLSAGFDALSTRLDSLDQRAGDSDSLLVVLFFFSCLPLVKPECERALTSKSQNTVRSWRMSLELNF